jgi:hypothetical protein
MENNMGVTKLRPGKATEASGDPLREALAAAIETAGKSRAALAQRKQGVHQLFSEASEADESIEKLQKAVREAQESYIGGLADAAAGSPAPPANGVPAAKAAVEVAMDHREALRAARKKIESEMPAWEADVVAADAEIERLISQILAPRVAQLAAEAQEAARRLAPLQGLLLAFVRDHENRPSAWHLQRAFDAGRAPLKAAAAEARACLQGIREFEVMPTNPFRAAREQLRENPNAALPELTALMGP